MVSRADLYRKNAENFQSKMKDKKDSKRDKKREKRGKYEKRKEDEIDKFIKSISKYSTLKDIRTEEITKIDGWAYFVADYFKTRLNTHQLRDIHYSFKKIDQLEEEWGKRKLYYNLLEIDIQLKKDKHVIPKKFYELMNTFFTITNRANDDEKLVNFKKIMVYIDALVAYHKYLEKNIRNTDKTLQEYRLKINNEYLLEISDNDKYITDTEKISAIINRKKDGIKIYQMRKIYNYFKYFERNLNNDWNNIHEEFNEFYPKLAYITGRNLISEEFFKLIIKCMDIIKQGENEEKIIKLKNFITYLESIISFITYQNKVSIK